MKDHMVREHCSKNVGKITKGNVKNSDVVGKANAKTGDEAVLNGIKEKKKREKE